MEELKSVLDVAKEEAAMIDIKKLVKHLGPIHCAVVSRDLSELEKLLRCGHDADDVDNTLYGFTATHWAAMVSNSDVLELLDKFGTNMSAVEETDLTPLHVAALAGNCDTLVWLVENTYDIESLDEYEQTPLHQAALNGRLEAVRILLDHGASIDAVDMFGMTPICLALVRGYDDVVCFLLEHEANPGVQDNNKKNLLHTAAANDDTFAISLFLGKGINVNATDNSNCTPLHDAAKHGCSRSVSLLLDNGAVADAKDYKGHTPLGMALEAGHMDCVRLLKKYRDCKNAAPEDMQANLTLNEDVDCIMEEVDCSISQCYSQREDPAAHGNISMQEVHLVDKDAGMNNKHCVSSLMAEEANEKDGETAAGLTDPTFNKGGHHPSDTSIAIEQVRSYLTIFYIRLPITAIHTEGCTEEEMRSEENFIIDGKTNVRHNEGRYSSSENDGCTPTDNLTLDDMIQIIF